MCRSALCASLFAVAVAGLLLVVSACSGEADVSHLEMPGDAVDATDVADALADTTAAPDAPADTVASDVADAAATTDAALADTTDTAADDANTADAEDTADTADMADMADTADMTDTTDAIDDTASPPGVVTLLEVSGLFLDIVDVAAEVSFQGVGQVGQQYATMTFAYDVVAGPWRLDLAERGALNHGLFGLLRDVPEGHQRYILGNAAQIHTDHANLRRQSIFYARVDLEKKPQGQGYTGYTSFRDTMLWVEGERYHIEIVLDAVAAQQRLTVSHLGQVVLTQVGDIPYFDPSLTSAGWDLEFGGEESDNREVRPIGWTLHDLEVTAEPL